MGDNKQYEDLFYLGIKAIIRNTDNKILVLKCQKSDRSYWDLPGGRIITNEMPEVALRREVAEETGLVISGSPLTHLGIFFSNIRIAIDNKKSAGLLYSVYNVCAVSKSTITLSAEHTEFAWVTPQHARSILDACLEPCFASF
ncbi:MAG TPA: NUDIX domain-containing protein [Candidatus Babeliales bacterium]|nr:NUDIX domain-containing protein [Candidatus Babeliales bacterium]